MRRAPTVSLVGARVGTDGAQPTGFVIDVH